MIIVYLFLDKVLKSVHVTVQDPLLLAYFVLDNCEAVALLLENSFVHAAVHQLRCLQLFLKFNEVSSSDIFDSWVANNESLCYNVTLTFKHGNNLKVFIVAKYMYA